MSMVELLSRSEERAGKLWPWSKRKTQWILSVSGDPIVVEITYSWNSGKSRVFVNHELVTCGTGYFFKYDFSPGSELHAVAMVSNRKAKLEVNGWPVEWLSPRIRREQAQLISVFATHSGYAQLTDLTNHGQLPSTSSSDITSASRKAFLKS